MKTMKKMMTWIAVAGLVLALASAVQAADITVSNHSFEEYVLSDGGYLGSNPAAWPGWTGVNYEQSKLGLWNPQDGSINGTTSSPIPAPGDGDNLITGQASSAPLWKLYQSPDSHTILANQVYTLTTAVAERKDGYVFSTMTISLKAGSHDGTALATRTLVRQDLLDVEGYTRGNLYDFAISFNSADFAGQVGQALYIVYEALTGVSGQAQVDNVRLSYDGGSGAATPGTLIYGK